MGRWLEITPAEQNAQNGTGNATTAATGSELSVIVRNLSFNTNEDNLWTTFEPCGKIENARIIKDKESGMSRGFGFVDFADHESA